MATEYGYTPLHSAAYHGHNAIIRKLLIQGASINAREFFAHQTPLICSAISGHADTVKLLLDNGADPNAKEKNGCTAVMHAWSKGHKNTVNILTNSGAVLDKDLSKCRVKALTPSDFGL